MKWRPMSTAPRKGYTYILLTDGNAVEIGYFDDRFGGDVWSPQMDPDSSWGQFSTPKGWMPLPHPVKGYED